MERLRLRSVTGNRRSGSGDNTNVYRHWRPWRDPPPARPPPTGCSQRPSDNADQLAALVTSRLVITSTIRVSVNGSTLSSSAFGPSTDSTTIPGLGSTILVCLVAGSSGPAVGLSSISSHRTLNPNARSALPVAIASSGTIACFTLGRLWNLGGVVGPTVEGAPFFLGEPESTAGTLPRPLAQGRCESRSSWTTPTASKPGVQPLEEQGTRAASRETEPGGVRGERGPGTHRARVQAQRAPVAAGALPVPVLRLGRLGEPLRQLRRRVGEPGVAFDDDGLHRVRQVHDDVGIGEHVAVVHRLLAAAVVPDVVQPQPVQRHHVRSAVRPAGRDPVLRRPLQLGTHRRPRQLPGGPPVLLRQVEQLGGRCHPAPLRAAAVVA